MAAELTQFANFELDRGAYELRRKGRVVPLQRIPLDLLLLLVERRGQLVTREEIIERIWGKEVFLDTESSINTAIGKLRRALRDHQGSPRFIATVPAKGYRFIAGVHEPTLQAVPIRDSQTAFPRRDCNMAESRAGPTGERRHLTVLFCDLTNSSRMAQHDPEEWWEIVADYQRATTQAIERNGGQVGQYRGAGVIAYFGWPEAHDNDAECAVRAGLAIVEAISKLNNHATKRLKLSPRVGIDSGAVVVAGSGKDAHLFGEPPNIAGRVEAAADPDTVFITAETHRLVSGLFMTEDRGAEVLNGIERSVQLYRVIRPSGVRGRFEAAVARGLTSFVGREDELGLLMNRWKCVLNGEGQVAVLIGEGGIGKSRLVQRFREQIAGTPHTWIETAAAPLFQNTPFHPVAEMFREAVARYDASSPERHADRPSNEMSAGLESVFALLGLNPAEAIPLVAPLLNLPIPAKYPPLPLSPEQQRRRLLVTLVEWVLGSARAQPLVIVTEDLHWATRQRWS